MLASAQVDTLPAGVSYRKLTEACANVIKYARLGSGKLFSY